MTSDISEQTVSRHLLDLGAQQEERAGLRAYRMSPKPGRLPQQPVPPNGKGQAPSQHDPSYHRQAAGIASRVLATPARSKHMQFVYRAGVVVIILLILASIGWVTY